jgi:hypothetical protein
MAIVRKVGDKSNSDVKVNNLPTNDIFEDNFITYKYTKDYLNGKSITNICHNDLVVNYFTEQTGHIFNNCEYCYWTVCQIVDNNGNLIDNQYKIWLIQPYKFTDVIKPFHERQIKKDAKYDIKSYIFKLYRSQKGNYGLIPYYKPNTNLIKEDISDNIIIDKILDKYLN